MRCKSYLSGVHDCTGASGIVAAVVLIAIRDAQRGDREARAWLLIHAPGVLHEYLGVSEAYTRQRLREKVGV